MKNNKKNCCLCSSTRLSRGKLCGDCVKIKNFIREYGIKSMLDFMDNYKRSCDIPFIPSAPSYQ